MGKRTVHFLFDKPKILFFGWKCNKKIAQNNKCYLVADKSKHICKLLTNNKEIELVVFNGDKLQKKFEPVLKNLFPKLKIKTEYSFPNTLRTNDDLEIMIETWIDSQLERGLKELWNDKSEILILGTFPGKESLKKDKQCEKEGQYNRCRYYSNKKNLFWEILTSFAKNRKILRSDSDKIKLLDRMHIALWDIYESAYRIDSKDENILRATYNDVFKRMKGSSIKTIILTGVSSNSKMHHLGFLQYYHKEVEMAIQRGVKILILPSSSARGRQKRKILKNKWKTLLKASIKKSEG